MEGREDRALGDGVAIADLGGVGKFGNVLALRFGGGREQQLATVLRHPFSPVEGLKNGLGTDIVAHQDAASQPLAPDDELLVNATAGFAVVDHFVVMEPRVLVAHHRDLDTHDLELGGDPGSRIHRVRVESGEPVGQDAGLLSQRGKQATELVLVLGTFADGVNVGLVAAAQVFLDDDAAAHLQPGLLGQIDVGHHLGGDHDQIALQGLAVLESDTSDPVLAHDRGGEPVEADLDAQVLHRLLEYRAGLAVQLSVHQVAAQMHNVDRHALGQQTAGRFQAQQPAAADHRLGAGLGRFHDHSAVVQRPEGENAGLESAFLVVHASHRGHVGAAAGGDDQLFVGFDDSASGIDRLGDAVDPASECPYGDGSRYRRTTGLD